MDITSNNNDLNYFINTAVYNLLLFIFNSLNPNNDNNDNNDYNFIYLVTSNKLSKIAKIYNSKVIDFIDIANEIITSNTNIKKIIDINELNNIIEYILQFDNKNHIVKFINEYAIISKYKYIYKIINELYKNDINY